jgi:iron complex outermembrane receptor protein
VNPNKYLLSFLMIILISSVSGNEEFIDEADIFNDIQTVTSATRLKQKITDAPVSVTIIDSDMIEASGATEVHELMRLVPGYFSYSTWGGQYAVTSHFQPKEAGIRLEVQVNGRSVYETFYTRVIWAALGIDVDDIDYIEVIRGSSATTYGSNAFLGAINIVTKDPLSRPKSSIRTRIGNIGRKELTVNHSGNNKDIDYAVSIVHKSNTGFPALDFIKNPRDLVNDDRDSLNINLQGVYVPDLENEFRFEVGIGRTDLEIPDSVDKRSFRVEEHFTNFQMLNWVNKQGAKEHSLKIFHTYLGLTDDLNYGLLSNLLDVSPSQIPLFFPDQQDGEYSPTLRGSFSQRFDIEYEQKGKISQAKYVWGLGARKDRVKSLTYFGEGIKSENRLRLFANLDWKINQKLNSNLGIFAEHTELNGIKYSPRVALNYHLKKNHTIRASATRGKRTPFIAAQNLAASLKFSDGTIIDADSFVTDTNLKTETITAYEIAYMANIPSNNTQFEVRVFKEKLNDLLEFQIHTFDDVDNSFRVLDNLLNATSQGLELQINHRFKKFIPGLNARLSYANFDTNGRFVLDARDNRIREATAIPKHSGTLMLSKKLANNYDFSTVFQYQSDYQNRDVAIKRVDLRLGKKFKYKKSKGKVDLVIQNAFGKYNDFAVRNNFKTRAFIKFGLDF